MRKDFPVSIEELEAELNLPEFVYTGSRVELSHTPVQAILSVESGRLERNDWYIPSKPGEMGYVRRLYAIHLERVSIDTCSTQSDSHEVTKPM